MESYKVECEFIDKICFGIVCPVCGTARIKRHIYKNSNGNLNNRIEIKNTNCLKKQKKECVLYIYINDGTKKYE